ncbi:GAF domain-containing sensor histidine kinase [Sporosarcina obsidiansis]|uniref:GAF domain-containing sensor histidine kinase n=1 Tax=Sporosarcina obsidiansis TaxID=2660748 RepID=UPI00129BF083|nr:ATP-binding protein [Sporosarcina obsidiansis]
MDKQEMIDLLTGVQSSKKNYYTELKNTVAQLTKKNKQLELINELMQGFSINFSVEQMLQQTFRSLQKIYPIEQVGIVLEQNLQMAPAYVFPAPTVSLVDLPILIPEYALFEKVFATGEETLHSSERSFGDQEDLPVVAYLTPLKSSGTTIAVLYLSSRSVFCQSEEDLDFFNQLASQIAVCLENARLYSEVLARKQQWEETFRAVSDGVLIIGADGTVQLQNKAAFAEWQLQVGEDIRTFINTAARSGDDPLAKTMETGIPQSAELHFNRQLYDCSCYPLFEENRSIKAVVVYSKNVTVKREMEVQLIHSNQLVAIGEMAAGVAHELNNPLTAIIGNSQLLLRMVDADDERIPLLEDIDSCGKRCRTTIRSLLAFSRQENSPFTICCLNDAVSQALALTKRQFENQRITIQTELSSLSPILGNVQQLSQILVNLLINAKDALVGCEEIDRNITIQTQETQESVELMLTDNGAMIAPHIIDDIFHPFFTTKDSESGTGLGLSVSLGLAQAHGGTLSVKQYDDPARKVFHLTLPIHCERQ